MGPKAWNMPEDTVDSVLWNAMIVGLLRTWYQTTPLMVVRSSPTIIAFHSTESTVSSGMFQALGPMHALSASGLDQCSSGVPPTSASIRPNGTLGESAE